MQGHGLAGFRDQDSLQQSLDMSSQSFHRDSLRDQAFLQNVLQSSLQSHALQSHSLQSLQNHGLQSHSLQNNSLQSHSLQSHAGLQSQALQAMGLQASEAQTLGMANQGAHNPTAYLSQENPVLPHSFNHQFQIQQAAGLSSQQTQQVASAAEQFDDSRVMNDLLKDYGVREHTISRCVAIRV